MSMLLNILSVAKLLCYDSGEVPFIDFYDFSILFIAVYILFLWNERSRKYNISHINGIAVAWWFILFLIYIHTACSFSISLFILDCNLPYLNKCPKFSSQMVLTIFNAYLFLIVLIDQKIKCVWVHIMLIREHVQFSTADAKQMDFINCISLLKYTVIRPCL